MTRSPMCDFHLMVVKFSTMVSFTTPLTHPLPDEDPAMYEFWPAFSPMSAVSGGHPLVKSWMDKCKQSSMVFFTFLFGAAENHFSRLGCQEVHSGNLVWRHKFHGVALRYVSKGIESLKANEAPSDELLACILTLAVYGANASPLPLGASSVMEEAQTLQVVSHRQHVHAHREALYYLLAKKGGLSKIGMFAVAELIQA